MAAITPSRMNPNLRLTPRASPFYKSPSSRSPIKGGREEQCLSLKKVIGTTSSSSNNFDGLDKNRTFAYVAGAAVVLARLNDDLSIEQRFFRAKPSSYAINHTTPLYDSPATTPTAISPKARLGASLRDGALSGGGFGSSVNDSIDSPTTRQSQAREKMKAASCISLSPDGNMLAVGETGYRPRVLIFSTSPDAPNDVPLSALSEHAFGVQCVAFSHDSKYLATLGDMNDGFLYIWRVNRKSGAVSLHASNKCTSSIKQIFWVGDSLLTIGTRHVKIWRIDKRDKKSTNKRISEASSIPASPSRALSGRNCLLGALLDKTFTAGAAISLNKAIVCAEDGTVCLMDDSDSLPNFYKVADAGFRVSALTCHSEKYAIISGELGELRHFTLDELLKVTPNSSRVTPTEERSFRPVANDAHTVALTSIGEHVLSLDSQRGINVLSLAMDDDDTISQCSIASRIPGHRAAVLGVQTTTVVHMANAAFLTYSADGSISLWDRQGVCVRELFVALQHSQPRWDGFVNELTAVKAFTQSNALVAGDKLGKLRIIDIATGTCRLEMNAHASEITDIAICERDSTQVIATSGRDRMIQIFHSQDENITLTQTVDEHVGAVTSLVFSPDGQILVSGSSDRSIIIRRCCTAVVEGTSKTAYVMLRSITLKSTPLSLDLGTGSRPELTVSTIDKQISRYSIDTGNCLGIFRANDQDDGDSVVINSAIRFMTGHNSPLIAGLSSTDKSIRVYSINGKLLGREYGHTEGMTGLVMLQQDRDADSSDMRVLVTVASDGTVFLWSLQCGNDQLGEMFDSLNLSSNNNSPVPSDTNTAAAIPRPPLRKVISTSELSQIQKATADAGADGLGILPMPMRARSRSPVRRRTSRLSTIPASSAFDPSSFDNQQRRQTFASSTSASSATATATATRPNFGSRRVSNGTPKVGAKAITSSSPDSSPKISNQAQTQPSTSVSTPTSTPTQTSSTPTQTKPQPQPSLTKNKPHPLARPRHSSSHPHSHTHHAHSTHHHHHARRRSASLTPSSLSLSVSKTKAKAASPSLLSASTSTSTSASNTTPPHTTTTATAAKDLTTSLRLFRKTLASSPSSHPTASDEMEKLAAELTATLKLLAAPASSSPSSSMGKGASKQTAQGAKRLEKINEVHNHAPTPRNKSVKAATAGGAVEKEAPDMSEDTTEMTTLLDSHAEKLLESMEARIRGCVSSEVARKLGKGGEGG